MEEKRKAGAPIGSANAKKEISADSHLHIRVTSADKARWVKAAQGRGGLSAWVVENLNSAAQGSHPNTSQAES